MNLRRQISLLLSWWRSVHPSKALERAIPAYRDAVGRERRARQRNDTKSIGRAVAARKAALHAALRGQG